MKRKFLFVLFVCGCFFQTLAQTDSQSADGPEKAVRVERTVKVFPNPATNVINVLGLSSSERAQIVILDLYGNSVQKHQWEIRNNALNIPIPTLAPGMYIIRIVSREQEVSAKFYKR